MSQKLSDDFQTLSDQKQGDPEDMVIESIEDALESGYEDAVIEQIGELGPAAAADLLAKVSDENRETLLDKHATAFDPLVFTELPYDLRKDILENMEAVQVAGLLSDLESDDALDMIIDLDPEFQREIIKKLSSRLRLVIEEGLRFPEDSAGRLMQREFVAIPQFWTVGKTIDYLRKASEDLPDEFFDIFIITPTYKVVGEVPLNKLVRAPRAEKMEHLVADAVSLIPADMDQEEVARIFRREDLTSAAVIDGSQRLIGVITIDDVIDVIDEETQEDIMRLGGVVDGGLHTSSLRTSWNRMRWLGITLVNTILASLVISRFEATIEEIVALAILMPIVAAMGGNAGMQVVTITVRGLATKELSPHNFRRLIAREMTVGTLNGLLFGMIMGGLATLWFGSLMLGSVLMAAMLFNMFWAGIAGTLIPIALTRLGFDPALAAGPFLTTTTDILGFMAFLGLATLILL